MFAILSKSCFHIHHCQSQHWCFLFKQPVSLEEWWRIFDITIFIITRVNVFHPCKIGRWYHIQTPAAARTTFCWVIEGTMTSAGHRLHTSDGHRTIFGNLNRTISTAAGHRTMWESKELSKISLQIGRCPSGHRPMFYESNCHQWEATCICRSTYRICIDMTLVKIKNLNSIIYVSLEELRMNNMQRKSAIQMFAILSKSCFHIHHCQSQHQCF